MGSSCQRCRALNGAGRLFEKPGVARGLRRVRLNHGGRDLAVRGQHLSLTTARLVLLTAFKPARRLAIEILNSGEQPRVVPFGILASIRDLPVGFAPEDFGHRGLGDPELVRDLAL